MFVRRKDEERQTAQRLRDEGWSLARIARELGVAKSSVSVWVRRPPSSHPPPLGEPLRDLPRRRLPIWLSGELRRLGGVRITCLPSASTDSARVGSGGADRASPRTSARAAHFIVVSHTPRSSREPKRCGNTSWTTSGGRRAWTAADVTP
jgi:transposase-like protein